MTPSPITQPQILLFYGYRNGIECHQFQALLGAQPPQLTSTPADIAVVDRPRSLGYTVPTGYDPWTMDVQIRFENWIDYSNPVNPDVEGDISKLLWMTNRGKLGPGPADNGNPPTVKLGSYDSAGNSTNVIPPDVQGIEWLISNIQWDPTPLRFTPAMIAARNLQVPVGSRARQDATVTLMQSNLAPGLSPTPVKPSNGTFAEYASVQYWNVRLMTAVYTGKTSQADFKTVMQLPANASLKLRNPGQRLRPGTKVFFPDSLLSA